MTYYMAEPNTKERAEELAKKLEATTKYKWETMLSHFQWYVVRQDI